jgi:hypothetical protein
MSTLEFNIGPSLMQAGAHGYDRIYITKLLDIARDELCALIATDRRFFRSGVAPALIAQ